MSSEIPALPSYQYLTAAIPVKSLSENVDTLPTILDTSHISTSTILDTSHISTSKSLSPVSISRSSERNSLDCSPCDCAEGHCDAFCGHSIVLSDTDPVFICNRTCPCNPECSNKLTNPGVKFDISRVDTKGWCLISSRQLPRHQYIGDYTGLIITSAAARTRHSSQSHANYILTLREQSTSGCLVTHIDATTHGNELRFMNHSCDPNVMVVLVRDNEVYPRATCWTTRGVGAGEELCFSYTNSVTSGGEREQFLGNVPCLCESEKCRRFLPLEPF